MARHGEAYVVARQSGYNSSSKAPLYGALGGRIESGVKVTVALTVSPNPNLGGTD